MQAPVTEAYLDWASGTQFPEDEPSSGVFLAGWQEGWYAGAADERKKYIAILEENVSLYEMAIAQAKVIKTYQQVSDAKTEMLASLIEKLGIEGYGTLFIANAVRKAGCVQGA